MRLAGTGSCDCRTVLVVSPWSWTEHTLGHSQIVATQIDTQRKALNLMSQWKYEEIVAVPTHLLTAIRDPGDIGRDLTRGWGLLLQTESCRVNFRLNAAGRYETRHTDSALSRIRWNTS